MSGKNKEDVIHRSSTALLVLDMLNTFDFEGGERLWSRTRPIARRIASLKARAKRKRIPVIYVNDCFAQWRSDWETLFERVTQEGCPGKPIAERLRPEEDDYFVLKPRHSGFYSTVLDVLLQEIGVRRLIVTGIAADICVLFTVHDAHVRDYKISVPADCLAAESAERKRAALRLMKSVFKVKTQNSAALRL